MWVTYGPLGAWRRPARLKTDQQLRWVTCWDTRPDPKDRSEGESSRGVLRGDGTCAAPTSDQGEVQVPIRTQPAFAPPLPTPTLTSEGTQVTQESSELAILPNNETPKERMTTASQGRCHLRALQPQLQNQRATPRTITRNQYPPFYGGDESGEAPQYVGPVHQFPTRLTRSGLVRDAG